MAQADSQEIVLPRFSSSAWIAVVSILFFTVICSFIQILGDASVSDRGKMPDEAAHFVSSLTIADYLSTLPFKNPLAFAKEYYAHFPKVAIGHWPPLFELLQAFFFLVLGRSTEVAMLFQALVGGVCAGIPTAIIARRFGCIAGGLTGAIVLFSPLFLNMLDTVMADNLLAVFVTVTALAWRFFYRVRSWAGSLFFALSASAAILTKGNGFALAFLPFIYLLIKRDLTFYFNRKMLFSGCFVGLLVLPWHILTYHMQADGFVYSWGWAYTKLAIPFNLHALFSTLGLPCAIAFIAGTILGITRPRHPSVSDPELDITAFIATALSVLLFGMLAPADLSPRYLIPLLPSAAIVSVWALSSLLNKAMPQIYSGYWPRLGFLALCVGLSLSLIFQKPTRHAFYSDRVVLDIEEAHQPNSLVLVSGSVLAEGALVSSFAEREPERTHYIVRAQKVLATTNWMATEYKLKFSNDNEMARWMVANEIGWIVIDTSEASMKFQHNVILKRALDSGLLSARLVDVVKHMGGEMDVYALPAVHKLPNMSDDVFSQLGPGHLGGL